MFGHKRNKRDQLARLVGLVVQQPGISQAELARQLGVARSTILKDLAALEEVGVRLYEDSQGRLYLNE